MCDCDRHCLVTLFLLKSDHVERSFGAEHRSSRGILLPSPSTAIFDGLSTNWIGYNFSLESRTWAYKESV